VDDMSYLKEACVETFEQIEQAAKAKIDRIELCDRLDLGGTTPKLKKIKFALNLFIPIVVMIRVNNTFYVSR
jgi:copper homeostasis protein